MEKNFKDSLPDEIVANHSILIQCASLLNEAFYLLKICYLTTNAS